MIEFSLLLRDYVTVNSTVRSGARVASTIPRQVVPEPFHQITADAIQSSGSAMPKDNIEFVYIYKANTKGFPCGPNATCNNSNTTYSGCPGVNCVKYTWDKNLDRFRDDATGSWNPLTNVTCPGRVQSVGVYLQARHNSLTGLFGSGWTIGDRAVLAMEPSREGACE
jgi:hypothetical protein